MITLNKYIILKPATSNSLKRNLVDEVDKSILIENQVKEEEALLGNMQQNQSAVKELSRLFIKIVFFNLL